MAKEGKKGMNLPNKITCARLVVAAIVLVILCVDWDALGLHWPDLFVLGITNDTD